jgi:hypothetical protein
LPISIPITAIPELSCRTWRKRTRRQNLEKQVEIALDKLRKVADLTKNPGKTITDLVADPAGTAQAHSDKSKRSAAEVEQVTTDTLRETAHAAEEVPKLREQIFETAIIECYRHREMYANPSCSRTKTLPELR